MGERRIDDTDRDDEDGIDNAAVTRRLGKVVRILERASNRLTKIRDAIAEPTPDDGNTISGQLGQIDAQAQGVTRLTGEIRAKLAPR
jgi:hypothetical protein